METGLFNWKMGLWAKIEGIEDPRVPRSVFIILNLISKLKAAIKPSQSALKYMNNYERTLKLHECIFHASWMLLSCFLNASFLLEISMNDRQTNIFISWIHLKSILQLSFRNKQKHSWSIIKAYRKHLQSIQ